VQIRLPNRLHLEAGLVSAGNCPDEVIAWPFGRRKFDLPNFYVRKVPAELLGHNPVMNYWPVDEEVKVGDSVEVQEARKVWKGCLVWCPASVVAVGRDEFRVRLWYKGGEGVVINLKGNEGGRKCFLGWRKMAKGDEAFWKSSAIQLLHGNSPTSTAACGNSPLFFRLG